MPFPRARIQIMEINITFQHLSELVLKLIQASFHSFRLSVLISFAELIACSTNSLKPVAQSSEYDYESKYCMATSCLAADAAGGGRSRRGARRAARSGRGRRGALRLRETRRAPRGGQGRSGERRTLETWHTADAGDEARDGRGRRGARRRSLYLDKQ